MSLLTRIATIVRSNINDLLGRAADPDKMAAQMMQDLGDAISVSRTELGNAVAHVKLLTADLRQKQQQAQEWHKKAELAVRAGKDELALECLRRQREYDAETAEYEQRVNEQEQVVAGLKRDLKLYESKHAEAQRHLERLRARARMADSQERARKGFDRAGRLDPSSPLGQMERAISQREAQSAAQAELGGESLESQLAALRVEETDLELQDALAKLKANVERQATDS